MDYRYEVFLGFKDTALSFNFDTYEQANAWTKKYMSQHGKDVISMAITYFDEEDNSTLMRWMNRGLNECYNTWMDN